MARTVGKAAKAAQATAKLQRSNSTKMVALNRMRDGATPTQLNKEMKIPIRTLARWKKDAKDAGSWVGAAGDSGLARPAKRKSDPGSGGHNSKVSEDVKKKIHCRA